MIDRHMDAGISERQSLGQAAFRFGNAAAESPPFFHAHTRPIESGFGAVIEEDEIDDLASGIGETEGDVRNPEDGFDIRDLLLDETD